MYTTTAGAFLQVTIAVFYLLIFPRIFVLVSVCKEMSEEEERIRERRECKSESVSGGILYR